MAKKGGGKNKELFGTFSLPSLTASRGKHGIPRVLNIPAAMVVSLRWYAEASASFQAALPAGKLPLDYTKVQLL